jgi:phosphoglycolate phosphatase-like HAD superfamily hydrolase
MLKKMRAIILDFDGVIVESNQIKHTAFSELFSQFPQYHDEIMAYHLRNNAVDRHKKFRFIMESIMHETYSSDRAHAWSEQYSGMTRQKIIACPYVRGAEEFIRDLGRILPLFLASATPQDELNLILDERGMTGSFQGIYGAPLKKIKIFEEIARKSSLTPDEIIFIGDSREDFISARDFGCNFIGRISGYNFKDVPARCFQDLYEIKAYIIQNLMSGDHHGLSHTTFQT